MLTRDLNRAKEWIRQRARGSERYGLVASSKAQRLKPHAIDIRVDVDPVQWFLKIVTIPAGVYEVVVGGELVRLSLKEIARSPFLF